MKHRFMFVAAWLAVALSGSSAARAAELMADGTYQYTLTQNGASTGTSVVTVKRTGSVISIHEAEEIADKQFGDVQAVADQAFALGTLAPLSFVAAYTSGGKTIDVRLALAGATGAFIHNGERLTVPVRMLPGTQVLAIMDQALVMSFVVLPAQAGAANASAFTIASPTAARTFVMRVDPALPPKSAGVPAADAGFAVASPVAFTVWFDPRSGVVDQIEVPGQSLVISLTKHS